MKERKLEYYILNAKVHEQKESTVDYYSQIVLSWSESHYRIATLGDNQHFYTLNNLQPFETGSELAYYGVISKFIRIDDLDFVDRDTGDLIEFELPPNIDARVNQYEFIFFPFCHRFAIIKTGKINQQIQKRGAPFKNLIEVIDLAFRNVTKSEYVHIELQQSEQIFEDIFKNDVLSLKVRVSYTNDDHITDDHQKILDEQMRSAGIGIFNARMTPDRSKVIDTNADLPKGLIELARENGDVVAMIKHKDGRREQINTKNHPEIGEVSLQESYFTFENFMNVILGIFTGRYRNK